MARHHITGWFKPSSSAARLVVRSKPYEFEHHYVPGIGSARCQIAACELCSQHGEARVTEIRVVEHNGGLFLLELNPDCFELSLEIGDEIYASRRKMQGCVETLLRRAGRVPAESVWPEAYLAAIGTRQYEQACRAPRLDDFVI